MSSKRIPPTVEVRKTITTYEVVRVRVWDALEEYPDDLSVLPEDKERLEQYREDCARVERQCQELIALRPEKRESYESQRDEAIYAIERKAIKLIGSTIEVEVEDA